MEFSARDPWRIRRRISAHVSAHGTSDHLGNPYLIIEHSAPDVRLALRLSPAEMDEVTAHWAKIRPQIVKQNPEEVHA